MVKFGSFSSAAKIANNVSYRPTPNVAGAISLAKTDPTTTFSSTSDCRNRSISLAFDTSAHIKGWTRIATNIRTRGQSISSSAASS